MYGLTRGTMTLLGVTAAGILLWLATRFETDAGNGEFWTQLGLCAAAGLVMALSQLLGGWTKWGWPRLSATVFLVGFLPALVAGGLVLLYAQPDGGFGSGLASDLGLETLAEDFGAVLPAIAFLIGLTFGFSFDTTGPLVDVDEDVVAERRTTAHLVDGTPTAEPVRAERGAIRRDDEVETEERPVTATLVDGRPTDRTATDEPVTAERWAMDDERERERDLTTEDRDVVYSGDGREHRRRGLFRRR